MKLISLYNAKYKVLNSALSYRYVLTLFFLLNTCWLSFPSTAQTFLPRGPLVISMSGAGRATTDRGSEYHLLNPAGFIHAPASEVSGYYVFGQVPKNYWGVSFSEKSRLPLAASFIKELDSESQLVNISAASFITKGWSIGVGVTRWKDQDSYWNAQLGTLIYPTGSVLSIGLTWDYFLPVKGAFEGHRQYGLGIEYKFTKNLNLKADVIYKPEKQWILASGGEIVFSKIFVLHLAGQMNFKTNEFLYSGGIGLQGQQMRINYIIKKNSEESDSWVHGVSVSSRL